MADSSDYFCESCATPYMTYFISDFDRLGWASGIPEMFTLDSLLGRRVMGSPTVRFGNIYPRTVGLPITRRPNRESRVNISGIHPRFPVRAPRNGKPHRSIRQHLPAHGLEHSRRRPQVGRVDRATSGGPGHQ